MQELEKSKIIAQCSDFLEASGLRLEVLRDIETVPQLVESISKPYLTPVSSPMWNDLHHGNALWLVGYQDDEPAMLGGARFEDLRGGSLADFWRSSLRRVYGEGISDVISDIDPVFATSVSGRIAYFGDLFVGQAYRGRRERLRAFTTAGHLLVSLKWDPDWTYAFVREADVLRGAAMNYGFTWNVPLPLRWIDPPEPRSNSEWCCLLSREDLSRMARASSQTLQAIKQA